MIKDELLSEMCPKCYGNKQLMGAGYMFYDCDLCDGKGKIAKELSRAIEKEEEKNLKKINEELNQVFGDQNGSIRSEQRNESIGGANKNIKKRGRPRKEIH